VKRLDKSIQSLMEMLRDYAHNRLMKIRNGYRGYKLFDIDKSHKKVTKLTFHWLKIMMRKESSGAFNQPPGLISMR